MKNKNVDYILDDRNVEFQKWQNISRLVGQRLLIDV